MAAGVPHRKSASCFDGIRTLHFKFFYGRCFPGLQRTISLRSMLRRARETS